jgi:uncharacterized protein GlcG (DUF336 family)
MMGHLISLERTDGTSIASLGIASETAASAVQFKRSTKAFEEARRRSVAVMKLARRFQGKVVFPLW